MIRAFILLAAFVGTAASAQYQPYPYPPPQPAPGYPAPAPGYPQPGYPGMQGPVLALPVLEADLRAKAGSDTVRFGRDSYVLTPQAQATLTAQAQWLIQHPFVRASIEGHADGRQTRGTTLLRSASAARRPCAII